MDHVASIDLRAAWLSVKYEIPAMLASAAARSSIRNDGSDAVWVYRIWRRHRFQHGIVGLTKSVAKTNAPQGTSGPTCCVGATATPMLLNWLPSIGLTPEAAGAAIPIGRMARPESRAEAPYGYARRVVLCHGGSSAGRRRIRTLDRRRLIWTVNFLQV